MNKKVKLTRFNTIHRDIMLLGKIGLKQENNDRRKINV